MTTVTDLLLDLLFDLVAEVPEEPRRVLFKGVSDLFSPFAERVQQKSLDWQVLVTHEGEDVVGARNDPSIITLVVFYRDEVRARESLNAFRQFDEDDLAARIVAKLPHLEQLPDRYEDGDRERLEHLLDLVYPSARQLARFLLAGKADVGTALPQLGLFMDNNLTYQSSQMSIRQWKGRLGDNYQAAVLRWRDFLEKGRRNRDARQLLGAARRDLLEKAETDPRVKADVLQQVSLSEALSVLNPPTRTVLHLMELGMLRHDAEEFVDQIRAGIIDPDNPPPATPTLPNRLLATLRSMKPAEEAEEEDIVVEVDSQRVGFCLEGLLRLAGQEAPLPARLALARADTENDRCAYLSIGDAGTLEVEASPDVLRALAVPKNGSGDLRFRIFDPQRAKDRQDLLYFTIENMATQIEKFDEIWPPSDFWRPEQAPHPELAIHWEALGTLVNQVRDVVDPNWLHEPENEEGETSEEPNNPIYLVFDLLYLKYRDLFDRFLDTWLLLLSAPWRHNFSSGAWDTVESVLQLGLARENGALAVLPFYPLRLAWYRAVFQQIEAWLVGANGAPLLFEPSVLSEQFQAEERPRVLFYNEEKYVEAATFPFFSLFVPELQKRRARAPLGRARVKLEQFGRMWPFSMTRLHVAFQPGDAGGDVYRLLTQQADTQPDSAYLVRAMVENTAVTTVFDRYLLTTTEEMTDLLTQEHHESMLPRLEYAKGQLEEQDGEPDVISTHTALLVDAFREENAGFKKLAGKLDIHHWHQFSQLVVTPSAENLQKLQEVDLSASAYHSRQERDGRREVGYVPLAAGQPEYLRLLYDSLAYSVQQRTFGEGAYFEVVRWDEDAITNLHNHSDWVILFDRTLDKSFFEKKLAEAGVRLIDFYANLPGGYRLSVSSRRVEAVKWQMRHVLRQFFSEENVNLDSVADRMLEALAGFASGLLLKTLGGGSLAQEMLGLYATYLSLIAHDLYRPGSDFLIPLDNYQNWFGRRTRRGRRADLLVVRAHAPSRLEMLAVESKWYKSSIGAAFVADEFGPDGQLRTTTQTLHSLFDPAQYRLDRDYWQRVLHDLLDDAPGPVRQILHQSDWDLKVDGIVFVHQYAAEEELSARAQELSDLAEKQIHEPDPEGGRRLGVGVDDTFWLGPGLQRVHLNNLPQLVALLQGER